MNRSFANLAGTIFLAAILLFFYCTKINEATGLGANLIPVVDNINTFDTTLQVEAYNEIFTILNDSIRLTRTDDHFLGVINADPIFGKTNASLFLELKPTYYPFTFENKKDSLYLDSVVLVLGYRQTYGDANVNQRVNVYTMDQSNVFRSDSAYLIRQNNFTYSGLLGTKTFAPKDLDDSVFLFREKSKNQLRIKLNNSFGRSLLDKDSTNAFRSDSAFKIFHKGFAIISDVAFGSKAMINISLSDTNTKLALYYRFDKNGKRDTTVTYFRFTAVSANANYVQRDYSGTPVASYQGGVTPDNLIFIQNTPGTFANIKIPALSILSNRVIHRAELIMEQVYDPSDKIFTKPAALYLDAYDSAKARHRTIPYDLFFDNTGSPNYESFGMLGKQTIDGSANPITIWKFNLSRYVQNILTGKEKNYSLRLFAPYFVYNLTKASGNVDFYQYIPVNPNIVSGRVRLGGGNHPTQRMRLRIIYSKL